MAIEVEAGERCVFVVAQHMFENGPNCFCTLIPVLREDGSRADSADFPDVGDVWWLVLGGKRGLAWPGRLVQAAVEASPAYKQGKAFFQVVANDIETVTADDYFEVIKVPAEQLADSRQLISGPLPVTFTNRPLSQVYVEWADHWYGPFGAAAEADGEGAWRVDLSPAASDNGVFRLTPAARKRLRAGAVVDISEDVSLTQHSPRDSFRTQRCRHVVVAAEALQTITAGAPRIVLQTEEAILTKAAKRLLSKSKYPQLRDLLRELDTAAESKAEPEDELKQTLQAVQSRHEAAADRAKQLADALLASDAFHPRLAEALRRAEAEHIEKHQARLQGEVEEKIARTNADHAAATAALRTLMDTLEAERNQARERLEASLRERQEQFESGLREREGLLDTTRAELERQRGALKTNLEDVAGRMGKNRDELVNQFLAISPLLGQLKLLPEAGPGPGAGAAPPPGRPRFVPQAFPVRPAEDMAEEAFVERFAKHVEASGFGHRPLDLLAFHLSVKCGDLTVLGGWPGTGKTSLARLYAEAAAGADGDRRFLHVAVSPSWLDPRDMIGCVNALDGRFQPTESFVFETLIAAHEEYARHGGNARLNFVCLDEMNLAQVEHYFGVFLQALELPASERLVRCFSAAAVAADDPYAPWGTLRLPPTVRFVGTVNFDETTRPLSQRTLDRTNLVRLRPPPYKGAGPAPATMAGPAVTAKHFRDWVKEAALDATAGGVLDSLAKPLAGLGCPLHARREKAIRRFVASAPPALCSPAQALDLQIAQRILPQIRNLFAPGAAGHVRTIRAALERQADKFPETLHWLGQLDADLGDGDPA